MSTTANSPGQLQPVSRLVYRHSRVVRVTHWINALCLALLLMSGLQIFNAHPSLNFGNQTDFKTPFLSLASKDDGKGGLAGTIVLFGRSFPTTGLLGASRGSTGAMEDRGFPSWMTIPSYQDLATGRRWHLFFAWVLVLNGTIYLLNLFAGRHLRDFIPTLGELRAIPKSIIDHARLHFPRGNEALRYNVLQKLAYLSVIVALPVMVLAGLAMSPGMDAIVPWLVGLFGGRQSARSVHFLIAFYLVGFFIVHVAMVLVSGFFNNMRSIITGNSKIEGDADGPATRT